MLSAGLINEDDEGSNRSSNYRRWRADDDDIELSGMEGRDEDEDEDVKASFLVNSLQKKKKNGRREGG
jgi:hypothetical protein